MTERVRTRERDILNEVLSLNAQEYAKRIVPTPRVHSSMKS